MRSMCRPRQRPPRSCMWRCRPRVPRGARRRRVRGLVRRRSPGRSCRRGAVRLYYHGRSLRWLESLVGEAEAGRGSRVAVRCRTAIPQPEDAGRSSREPWPHCSLKRAVAGSGRCQSDPIMPLSQAIPLGAGVGSAGPAERPMTPRHRDAVIGDFSLEPGARRVAFASRRPSRCRAPVSRRTLGGLQGSASPGVPSERSRGPGARQMAATAG